MGIDAVVQPESEERTALLDVDTGRRANYSGTSTPVPSMFILLTFAHSVYFTGVPISTSIPFSIILSKLFTNTSVGLQSGKDTSVFVKRARYYVPSLAWIPNYSFNLCAFMQNMTFATSS